MAFLRTGNELPNRGADNHATISARSEPGLAQILLLDLAHVRVALQRKHIRNRRNSLPRPAMPPSAMMRRKVACIAATAARIA